MLVCTLQLPDQSVRADVWVMKDHGVKESWTKLATIPNVGESSMFQYSVKAFF